MKRSLVEVRANAFIFALVGYLVGLVTSSGCSSRIGCMPKESTVAILREVAVPLDELEARQVLLEVRKSQFDDWDEWAETRTIVTDECGIYEVPGEGNQDG